MTRQSSEIDRVNVQDENLDLFPARIALAVTLAGGNTVVHEKTGLSASALSKWRTGKSEPTRPNLIKIAEASGVRLEWLMTGNGPIRPNENGDLVTEKGSTTRRFFDESCEEIDPETHLPIDLGRKPEAEQDFVLIPSYDVQASVGNDALLHEENFFDYLAFRRTWLRQEFGASAVDMYIIEVIGDSMADTLVPGDILLVDHRPDRTIPADGVFLLRIDGSLLVKRIQRLPGGRIKVKSDNQAYESFELDLAKPDDGFSIIGRVVWSGRRM